MVTHPIRELQRARESARSLDDSNADACFLALAGPSVRTLITRDIGDRGITLFINKTSAKWETILKNPEAQLLFWFNSLQKQYRVSGRIEELDAVEIEENWRRRPAGSKHLDHAYGSFARQSSAIASRDSLVRHINRQKETIDEDKMTRPPGATGILLRPGAIERLDLNDRDRLHDRRLFIRTHAEWEEQVLMP